MIEFLNIKGAVKEIIGEFHCVSGSGFFYPSYITKDGYLAILSANDNKQGIITDVIMVDLFSGKLKQGQGVDSAVP